MQSSAVVMEGTFAPARVSSYSPVSMLAIAQREGEDAKLCGLTRSLHRRLLALNMPEAHKAHRKPITSVTLSALDVLEGKRIA